jgi:hypothetical protein
MESYRTISDWRSVFDSYEDSVDEFFQGIKSEPQTALLTANCYMKQNNKYSKKAEQVAFTQHELHSSFVPESSPGALSAPTLNFNYTTCWLEDASPEYHNKKIFKNQIFGCLRL